MYCIRRASSFWASAVHREDKVQWKLYSTGYSSDTLISNRQILLHTLRYNILRKCTQLRAFGINFIHYVYTVKWIVLSWNDKICRFELEESFQKNMFLRMLAKPMQNECLLHSISSNERNLGKLNPLKRHTFLSLIHSTTVSVLILNAYIFYFLIVFYSTLVRSCLRP